MEQGLKVRVRMPPSPTGNLHIGNARSFLFNWLFARKNGGEVIFRIEDTDKERSKKEYEENIIDGLKWLGITWDNKKIFRQSERLDRYAECLKSLIDSGKAFWCNHSVKELEAEQEEQISKKEPPRHICEHKREKRTEGQIIRLSVNENSTEKIVFDDEIRGRIEWDEHLLGDVSLAKDLNNPLYNFAVVVDDHDMGITHVIRGEDHISNTPKQLLVYRALNFAIPKFAHLPMILGQDKSKLSKRHGAMSVSDYRKNYLPEALNNFLGFLGYTYSKEIISKEEMAEEFDIKKVHKSGAVWDEKKLNWINAQYIRQLSLPDFKKIVGIKELPDPAIPLITERLDKIGDIAGFDYFWKEPEYDKELLKWKKFDLNEIKKSLEQTEEIIKIFDFKEEKDALRLLLDDLAKRIGDPSTGSISSPQAGSGRDRGLVYWPLRVALTGKDKSPDPVEIAFVLGKEKTLKRVEEAIRRM